MAEIVHNTIRASYPIWIVCDKCNERVELVRARSCIEKGEYITVIDINHKCKEKEKASTIKDKKRIIEGCSRIYEKPKREPPTP